MSILGSCLSSLRNFISSNVNPLKCDVQSRNFIKAKTRRDMKRRNLAKVHANLRLRLVAMKRNDILPVEIKEDVCNMIEEHIPRQTALRQMTFRCIITSRAYGVVPRWRLSRFMFRHLSDYNKLSGVQRAMW